MQSPATQAMLLQLKKSKLDSQQRVVTLVTKVSGTRDPITQEELDALTEAICDLATVLRAECDYLMTLSLEP